jgi:hypothetical protein
LREGLAGAPRTLAAQRAEVAVRALLSESCLEVLRCRPRAGLRAALDALRFMGELSDDGKVGPTA